MQYECPECKNRKTKHYPLYTDIEGNPTDGSYLSYCTICDWEEKIEDAEIGFPIMKVGGK